MVALILLGLLVLGVGFYWLLIKVIDNVTRGG